MAKSKSNKQSEKAFHSVRLDSNPLSKNKKRKEKRHLKKALEEKTKTGEFIPVKQSPLKNSGVNAKLNRSAALNANLTSKKKPSKQCVFEKGNVNIQDKIAEKKALKRPIHDSEGKNSGSESEENYSDMDGGSFVDMSAEESDGDESGDEVEDENDIFDDGESVESESDAVKNDGSEEDDHDSSDESDGSQILRTGIMNKNEKSNRASKPLKKIPALVPHEVKSGVSKTQQKSAGPRNIKTIGFIRLIPPNVTEDDIKNAIISVTKLNNIETVQLAKPRKNKKFRFAYVHTKDAESLTAILNKKYNVGEFQFNVCPSKREIVMRPVAFVPRAPFTIKTDDIKNAVEAITGNGSVTEMREMRVMDKYQNRNILIYFNDIQMAKKAVLIGKFMIDNQVVVVREAREAGIDIPIFRIVVTKIPEGTTEAELKETLESQLGNGTVQQINFSLRKKSYAFVVVETLEVQKKALNLKDTLSINNTKLEVIEYIARKLTKRGKANRKSESKNKTKKRKLTESPNAKFSKAKKMKMQDQRTNKPAEGLGAAAAASEELIPVKKNKAKKLKSQKNVINKLGLDNSGEIQKQTNIQYDNTRVQNKVKIEPLTSENFTSHKKNGESSKFGKKRGTNPTFRNSKIKSSNHSSEHFNKKKKNSVKTFGSTKFMIDAKQRPWAKSQGNNISTT